jgi:hypothetical protein
VAAHSAEEGAALDPEIQVLRSGPEPSLEGVERLFLLAGGLEQLSQPEPERHVVRLFPDGLAQYQERIEPATQPLEVANSGQNDASRGVITADPGQGQPGRREIRHEGEECGAFVLGRFARIPFEGERIKSEIGVVRAVPGPAVEKVHG